MPDLKCKYAFRRSTISRRLQCPGAESGIANPMGPAYVQTFRAIHLIFAQEDMVQGNFLTSLAELETEFRSMNPELELTVRDPAQGVEGFVVVWNSQIAKHGPLGPCGKGGTRITPSTSLDEIRMLAQRMALKNAGAGLPLGGAKSGMRDDSNSPGFEKRFRRFTQRVAPILVERGGIFGGFGFDVGARPELPIWACDELKTLKCFTGKPLSMGGTDYDKEGIAGLGVATAAKAYLQKRGTDLEQTTFAVQGVGAMGAAVIRYFGVTGAKLTAVSDPRIGGTHRLNTFASSALVNALSTQQFDVAKTLLAEEASNISTDSNDVLYERVELLFPCALQEVIRGDNAAKIQAPLIVEGANGPCTVEAYSYLLSNNHVVVPDFIANPGGIIAAFVEMTSTISPEENVRSRGNVERAKTLTENKITANVAELCDLIAEYRVTSLEASRYLALRAMLRSKPTAQ